MEKILPLVNWFKRWGFCGWLRFRMLYFAHRIIGDGLAEQWDFAKKHFQGNYAIDLGSTYSLFLYELKRKFRKVYAVDLRPYQERLPKNINFIKQDIINVEYTMADFISMISVIQFIKNKKKYLEKISHILKPKGFKGGVLVITVPSNKMDIVELNELSNSSGLLIFDYQECKGHISIALIKKGA